MSAVRRWLEAGALPRIVRELSRSTQPDKGGQAFDPRPCARLLLLGITSLQAFERHRHGDPCGIT